MGKYGTESIHNWLNMFLTNRQMKLEVEGEQYEEVTADPVVPQGTVLWPLRFLCHINDLPCAVTSSLRLSKYADQYRHRKTMTFSKKISVNTLNAWANNLGKRFNAKKMLYSKHKTKSQTLYSLNEKGLQQVQHNPQLGLQIVEDVKGITYISNVAKKANSTPSFLRIYYPPECKKPAHIWLVMSKM